MHEVDRVTVEELHGWFAWDDVKKKKAKQKPGRGGAQAGRHQGR